MSPMAPGFSPGGFDVVVCDGTMDQTGDPARAIQRLAQLLKPGGSLVVAFDHSYGQVPASLLGHAPKVSDPGRGAHTAAQVAGWMTRAGLAFTRAVPGDAAMPTGGALLQADNTSPSWWSEFAQVFSSSPDARTFVVVGRRPLASASQDSQREVS